MIVSFHVVSIAICLYYYIPICLFCLDSYPLFKIQIQIISNRFHFIFTVMNSKCYRLNIGIEIIQFLVIKQYLINQPLEKQFFHKSFLFLAEYKLIILLFLIKVTFR